MCWHVILDDLKPWCFLNCNKNRKNRDYSVYKTSLNIFSLLMDDPILTEWLEPWAQCVRVCLCVISHMTDHMEQWAQRHGSCSGEMWSCLENLILLNMNAAFWKYVNLANNPLPTSQQADVSSHTGNYISNCGWLRSFIQAFISTHTARCCGFLSTVPWVCIFSMSHPVLLTTFDTATQSWQFNRLSTQDKFFQERDECRPLRAWHVYMCRWFSGH